MVRLFDLGARVGHLFGFLDPRDSANELNRTKPNESVPRIGPYSKDRTNRFLGYRTVHERSCCKLFVCRLFEITICGSHMSKITI